MCFTVLEFAYDTEGTLKEPDSKGNPISSGKHQTVRF